MFLSLLFWTCMCIYTGLNVYVSVSLKMLLTEHTSIKVVVHIYANEPLLHDFSGLFSRVFNIPSRSFQSHKSPLLVRYEAVKLCWSLSLSFALSLSACSFVFLLFSLSCSFVFSSSFCFILLGLYFFVFFLFSEFSYFLYFPFLSLS